jgi:pilus assembly protein CpaE
MAAIDLAVLTEDLQLQSELRSAVSSLGEAQPRLRFAASHRELLEAVRSRTPTLVLAPFGDLPADVSKLARELASLEHPVPVAAILPPHGFGHEAQESNILIQAMRAGVRDFLRRPISTTELRTLLENLASNRDRPSPHAEPTFGKVVSFISNKGGVGKSTLAVNTAVGLAARRPGRVLLIDGSLQMGVAAALLDVHPESTLSDAAKERDRLDVTMIRQMATQTPYGVHLLAAPVDAVDAADVDDGLMSRIITLGRRAYDFVIVDTFPMFDRVVIATLDLSDRAYVVMENVVPTLLGAVKMLEVLERIGFAAARQSLVINRHQRVAGSLTLSEVAARLGRPIDHVLPFDKRVVKAANSGMPIGARAVTFGFGGFSRPLRRLVDDVASLEGSGSPLSTKLQAAEGDARSDARGPAVLPITNLEPTS